MDKEDEMAIERTVLPDGTVIELLTDEDARWDKTNEELEREGK